MAETRKRTFHLLHPFGSFPRFPPEDRPYILALGLVLAIMFSVFLFFPFGTCDDYLRTWKNIISPQTAAIVQLKSNMLDGRSLSGVFLWLFFRPRSISYFALYRLANLLLLFVLAVILYAVLKKGASKRSAFLLTVITFALPSFSIMFYFASLVGVISGGILSGLAAWLLNDPRRKTLQKAAGFPSAPRAFFSFLLLFCALQVYQPIAMFFWVFTAILLASDCQEGAQKFLRRFLSALVVFLLALAAAYLLLKAAPAITGIPLRNNRNELIGVQQLFEKIYWFFNKPLPLSLNFFLLPPIPMALVWTTLVFLSGGLFLWFKGTAASRLVKMLVMLSLVPLAYLPNLVVTENWASYRSMIALSSMWVFLLYFCAKGYLRLLPRWKEGIGNAGKTILYGWAFIAVMFSIYHSLMYLIIPVFIEHRYIHYQVTEFGLKAGDTVNVVLADYAGGPAPFAFGDEFGMPPTAYSWGALSVTNLVILESGFSPGEIQVVLAKDSERAPNNPPGSYLLDLRKLKDMQLKRSMYPIERIKLLVDAAFHVLPGY